VRHRTGNDLGEVRQPERLMNLPQVRDVNQPCQICGVCQPQMAKSTPQDERAAQSIAQQPLFESNRTQMMFSTVPGWI
jgi:hypothetical protein